jgi:excinuclease ABC subunit C
MEKNIKSCRPGVYLFKGNNENVLYVGKAKNLKNRIKSYFYKKNDSKTESLVSASTKIEYIETKTEIEATFLEVRLIQHYQPKFNVIFKSGQPYLYLFFSKGTVKKLPELEIVKNKTRTGKYFGPFLEKGAARKVHSFLVRTFNLKICGKKIENGCLYFHLKICSGSCKSNFDKKAYLERLELAKKSLKKVSPSAKDAQKTFLSELKEKIKQENKKLNFEKSRELYSYYQAFEKVFSSLNTKKEVLKVDLEILQAKTEEKKEKELSQEIKKFLKLTSEPKTIDCFDVSHKQGHFMVGSCIRFTNGKPDKNFFRKFKIKTVKNQDDYACLKEIVSRRYRNKADIPDLVLIDGGKGQLSAVQSVIPDAECASIAKKQEIIFSKQLPNGKKLDVKSPVGKTFIALRDYAHHFAISYHRKASNFISIRSI